MKVILRQNFSDLGKIGDVVEVKDGYALNYLIPRKIAFTAVAGNLRALNEEKKSYDKKLKKEIGDAEALAAEIEKLTIEIAVKVGEEGKLYGSVTTQMVADALTEKGFDLDKRKIEIAEQIKSVGLYPVEVKLHPQVTAKVKVLVKEEAKQGVEEAAPQAEEPAAEQTVSEEPTAE
jgi:large subunit ribosomal protein L9